MSEIIYERPNLLDTTHDGSEIIGNNRFAFLLFLGADVMLFAGLIGGYVVLHFNTITWPPPGSPDVNRALMLWTCPLILIAFLGVTLGTKADRVHKSDRTRAFLWLAVAAFTGFLILNAIEWTRLFQEGLQIMTIFGGIYLINMGTFLIHLIIGLGVLLGTLRGLRRSPNTLTHLTYYFFVLTVVWLTLYGLIYIL